MRAPYSTSVRQFSLFFVDSLRIPADSPCPCNHQSTVMSFARIYLSMKNEKIENKKRKIEPRNSKKGIKWFFYSHLPSLKQRKTF